MVKEKTHCMIRSKNTDTLDIGDPNECGSFWTKVPVGELYETSWDYAPLTSKAMRGDHIILPIEGGKEIIRKIGEIAKGQYAYGLTPHYAQAPPVSVDDNSPYLPELIYKEPILQFNMGKGDLTIRQLAIIGSSTWALLKKDAEIIR